MGWRWGVIGGWVEGGWVEWGGWGGWVGGVGWGGGGGCEVCVYVFVLVCVCLCFCWGGGGTGGHHFDASWLAWDQFWTHWISKGRSAWRFSMDSAQSQELETSCIL